MHLRHLLTTPTTRRRSAWIAYLGDKCSSLRAALDSSEATNRDLTARNTELEQQLRDAHDATTPRPRLPEDTIELRRQYLLERAARAATETQLATVQAANISLTRALYDRAVAPARTEAA